MAAILNNRKFLQMVSGTLKTSLCTVQQWCDRINQSTNSNKMAVIPYIRKRNLEGLTEPTLFNKTIQLTSEVKYFRLMLDKALTWKKQLDNAINKAYRAFWTCRSTFGKTWGLKPRVVYWIYIAVV
jgi:hypothetical protein